MRTTEEPKTMTRSPIRRAFFFLFTFSLPVLVMGCPKKPVPVEDAGEPAPAASPTVANLAPLGDDGGDEGGDASDGGKKWVGPSVNPNQQKIKACCNAMRATHDPMLMAVAGQCDTFAAQVGPSGSDPAFAQLRAILKGQKLPGACSGM
jgi:hypothetical protein